MDGRGGKAWSVSDGVVVCVSGWEDGERERDGKGEVASVGVGAAVHGCVAVVTAVRVRGSQCGETPTV